jgi:hypothetical protein
VRLGEAHICPAILEFLILFLSRSSWAFVVWEVFLHGLAIGTPSPWSGIDKFLVSLEWETQLLDSLQKRLSRLCSDHFPFFLIVEALLEPKDTSSLFSYYLWLKSEGFVDRVKLWWSSYHFQGFPRYILTCKLKALNCGESP